MSATLYIHICRDITLTLSLFNQPKKHLPSDVAADEEPYILTTIHTYKHTLTLTNTPQPLQDDFFVFQLARVVGGFSMLAGLLPRILCMLVLGNHSTAIALVSVTGCYGTKPYTEGMKYGFHIFFE
jgi:hypothetical protein